MVTRNTKVWDETSSRVQLPTQVLHPSLWTRAKAQNICFTIVLKRKNDPCELVSKQNFPNTIAKVGGITHKEIAGGQSSGFQPGLTGLDLSENLRPWLMDNNDVKINANIFSQLVSLISNSKMWYQTS